MKHVIAAAFTVCCLTISPLAAQEAGDAEGGEDGPSLMERGAELFWRGLREEMQPSLQELEGFMSRIGPSMQSFLAEMGPALADIADKVEDWSRYEAPEILPNGDIIIRRKPDAPEGETLPDDGAGATDI